MVSDNPFNALFFGGAPRAEEFMLWLIDDDAEGQEEVIQKLSNPLYVLLRTHSFAQRLHHKLYPVMREAEEKWEAERGGGEYEWPVDDSARMFLDAWEREVKRPVGGYVYFLGSEEHGVVKIGRSKNPDERVPTLEIQLPFPVELLHTIECADDIEAETFYHRKYSDKRTKGEWFRLTEEDLKEIRAVSYRGKNE